MRTRPQHRRPLGVPDQLGLDRQRPGQGFTQPHGLAFRHGQAFAGGQPKLVFHPRLRRGRLRQGQKNQVRGRGRNLRRAQVNGVCPLREHGLQQPESQVAGLVGRPGRCVGRRQEHADGVRLGSDPLLFGRVEFAQFGNGHFRVRVVAQNDQRVFRGRGQGHRSREQNPRMPAAGDDYPVRRNNGFRQHGSRGNAVRHFPDLHARAASAPGREPDVRPGKLRVAAQNERLRQRVHPVRGHGLDLPERLRRQRALAHEHGGSFGTAFPALEFHRLGSRRNAGRNDEMPGQRPGFVRRQRAFLSFNRNAVKGDAPQYFTGAEARYLERHFYLAEVFKVRCRGRHGFHGGLRAPAPHNVVITVKRDIERPRYGTGPRCLYFIPAVHSRQKLHRRGQRFKGHVRIDLHRSRSVRLGNEHGGREGPGHGRGHVPGQGVDVGPERQGQHAVHHGGGLRYALVAHVVPQQRVHKKPHTRPGFPREHVRFQPLPGYFLQGVFHTGRQSFHVREGHHAHAVILDRALFRLPPYLGHAGQRQGRFRHGGGFGVVFRRHPLNPGKCPVPCNAQPVDTRQRLIIGHHDARTGNSPGHGKAVIIRVFRRQRLVQVGIRHLIGRTRGRFVSRGRPIHRVPGALVVRPGFIHRIPLLDFHQGHDRCVRERVRAAGIAAVYHRDRFLQRHP